MRSPVDMMNAEIFGLGMVNFISHAMMNLMLDNESANL